MKTFQRQYICIAVAILLVAAMVYPIKSHEGYRPALHTMFRKMFVHEDGLKPKVSTVYRPHHTDGLIKPHALFGEIAKSIHENSIHEAVHPSNDNPDHLLLSDHLPHPKDHHKLLTHHRHMNLQHHLLHEASSVPHLRRLKLF